MFMSQWSYSVGLSQNDMMQWLIDAAPCDEKLTVPQLTTHMLHVNSTAILTSSVVRQ